MPVLVVGLLRVVTYAPDTAALVPIGSVAAAARAAQTARFAITMRTKDGDVTSTLTGAGALDFDRGLYAFQLQAGPADTSLIGSATRLWLRLPDTAVHGGRHWVSFASTDGVKELPRPTELLDQLATLSGQTPRVRGHARVGGVRTTRYVVTTTIAGRVATITLYVDADHLPRRITETTQGSPRVEISADYYDYGRPVGLAPPPAADTVTVTDEAAARALMGAGGA